MAYQKYRFTDNYVFAYRARKPFGKIVTNYQGDYQLYIMQGMPRDIVVKKLINDIPEFCKKYNINLNTHPLLLSAI